MPQHRDDILKLLNQASDNIKLVLSDLSLLTPATDEVFIRTKKITGVDWKDTMYGSFNGLKFNWNVRGSTDEEINGYVMGKVNILPIEKMSTDWNLERDAPFMKDFFVLDYFTPENCVGFYKGLDYLYLYEMGSGETQYLSLDLNGYIEVCLAAHGFLYWQDIVVDIIKGTTGHSSTLFQKHMPGIFPDASLEKIRETYERVKIKPKTM